MRYGLSLSLALILVWGGCGGLSVSPARAQQESAREKPKWKDFGSSLKRLKWDEEKKAGVEGGRKKEHRSASEEDDDVVRVETTLVICNVLVLDRQGRSVHGLTREDFVVTEDGQPQQVGVFSLGDDALFPRTIVLIIDYSGSQFPFIKTSIEAAKTLVDSLGPRDVMAIVTDDVELLADFTADKKKLKKRLESLEKRTSSAGGFFDSPRRRFGRSAQYSALMATLSEAFDEEDLRPVIIFQTDGDEVNLLREPIISPYVPPNLPPDMHKEALKTVSRLQQYQRDNMREFSLDDVYIAAEKSRATVYTVIPGYRLIGLTPDEQAAQIKAHRERSLAAWGINPEIRERIESRQKRMSVEALKREYEQSLKVQLALVEVARVTGGWADFLEEPSQAAGIYSRIFSDVNRRYIVGYYPTNKEHDGRRRRVEIEVRGHPEYTVWGRKTYFAPQSER